MLAGFASLPATPRTIEALRKGREMISDIQGQLDGVLALLRAPDPQIDIAVPDRLAGAARQAGRALAALTDLRRLVTDQP